MTKSRNSRTAATTTISAGTKIEGHILGSEDLEVLGHAIGTIAIEGTLEVATSGIIEADIEATRVVIAGVVVGTITATEALIIEATGRVVGELNAPTLRIAEGAQYAGRMDVGGRARVEARTETKVETQVETETEDEVTVEANTPSPETKMERRGTKRIVVKRPNRAPMNGGEAVVANA